MGSKGEKKSGLVGEKSHTVYSANWKLDELLEKELSMFDTSKRRVEHRISMDQVVAKKRFQTKLHRSKVFHARMKGDKDMLKKLITKDNYDFHTNTTSVDVLNKRREKDLAKKRILHRQSQEKMMLYRDATPAATQVDATGQSPVPDNNGGHLQATSADGILQKPMIRPMTAIERISSAKIMAGRSNKLRPATAAVDKTRLLKSSKSVSLPPPTTSTNMRVIPETHAPKETVDGEQESRYNNTRKESNDILIKVTSADEEINESNLHQKSPNNNQTDDLKSSGNYTGLAETTQSLDEHGRNGGTVENNDSQSNERQGVTITETAINLPKKSSLRPSTAVNAKSKSSKLLRSTTAHVRSGSKQPLLTTPEELETSVTITDHASSDQSDNESTASAYRRPNFSRPKSRSNRKRDTVSLFSDQKKVTIMDIDQDRRMRSNHKQRINEYVNTIADVKTDPDLIVDYYMARLLEESNISDIQKNVESIRDIPDSDYDKDLTKRSLGDLSSNTVTFRDVNRSYEEYEHDPYSPLPPSSMNFSLLSRNSSLGMVKRQESRISMPTTAWQGDNSDTDST